MTSTDPAANASASSAPRARSAPARSTCIALHPDAFEVFALTGQRRLDELFAQIVRWRPRFAAVPDAAAANELGARVKAAGIATEVLAGAKALEELAAHPDVDQVMAAIVGAAGLPACLAAARAGKRPAAGQQGGAGRRRPAVRRRRASRAGRR